MTRVIFYLEVTDCVAFLGKFLHNKIVEADRQALLYGDDKTIRQLDEFLWLNRGFLPHCLLDAEAAADTPILLTDVPPPPHHKADILISLHDEVPGFVGQFPLYVDIVGKPEADKARGRRRYKYFRDHGYPIEYHVIN